MGEGAHLAQSNSHATPNVSTPQGNVSLHRGSSQCHESSTNTFIVANGSTTERHGGKAPGNSIQRRLQVALVSHPGGWRETARAAPHRESQRHHNQPHITKLRPITKAHNPMKTLRMLRADVPQPRFRIARARRQRDAPVPQGPDGGRDEAHQLSAVFPAPSS